MLVVWAPIGYLIVVIGRQQLFTENTVTAVIPVLAHPNLATVSANVAPMGRRAGRQSGGRSRGGVDHWEHITIGEHIDV